MHKIAYAILFFVLWIPAYYIEGQNASNSCDSDALKDSIATIVQDLAEVQSTLDAGDTSLALQQILDLEQALAAVRRQCSGLTFQGQANDLIGPIEFPDGIYRVTVTTTGFLSATVEPLSGTCETSMFGLRLFSLSQGDATSGAETRLTSRSCSALIVVSNVSAPWSLVFENLTSPEIVDGTVSPQPTAATSGQLDNLIQPNSSVNGFLFSNSTAEYFIDVERGTAITISAVRTGGTADLALELYGPSGALLFADDNSNPEGILNPMIRDLPVPESGRYRVVVTRCSFCNQQSSASFTLSFETNG